ncbi:hypothetical protein LR48_Vigan02g054600 [Vigna angularis]|uniref:Uncharacterized protein n=2 Tax=Phaseolus angularis TaxID=3914 RepID=A0A0L9TV64_PHAAN|nr:hypothetical protein LR48_Vigan02g054600 [Vigna angularis]BAT96200.1 hypothetical protein VIGAN_08309800 [Vigna angularis var. angularis]
MSRLGQKKVATFSRLFMAATRPAWRQPLCTSRSSFINKNPANKRAAHCIHSSLEVYTEQLHQQFKHPTLHGLVNHATPFFAGSKKRMERKPFQQQLERCTVRNNSCHFHSRCWPLLNGVTFSLMMESIICISFKHTFTAGWRGVLWCHGPATYKKKKKSCSVLEGSTLQFGRSFSVQQ